MQMSQSKTMKIIGGFSPIFRMIMMWMMWIIPGARGMWLLCFIIISVRFVSSSLQHTIMVFGITSLLTIHNKHIFSITHRCYTFIF